MSPSGNRPCASISPHLAGGDFSNLAVFNHTDLQRGGDFPARFARIKEMADAVLIDEAHHFRNPGQGGRRPRHPGRSPAHSLTLPPALRPARRAHRLQAALPAHRHAGQQPAHRPATHDRVVLAASCPTTSRPRSASTRCRATSARWKRTCSKPPPATAQETVADRPLRGREGAGRRRPLPGPRRAAQPGLRPRKPASAGRVGRHLPHARRPQGRRL